MSDGKTVLFRNVKFLSGAKAAKKFKSHNVVSSDRVRFYKCTCSNGRFVVPTERTTFNDCHFTDLYMNDIDIFSRTANRRTAVIRGCTTDKMWIGEGNMAIIEGKSAIGKLVVSGYAYILDADFDEVIVTPPGHVYACALAMLHRVVVEGVLEPFDCAIDRIRLQCGGRVLGLGKNKIKTPNITAENHLHYIEKDDIWIGY